MRTHKTIIVVRGRSRYDLRMSKNNAIIKRRGPDRKLWYVVAHAADMATAEIPAGLLRHAGIPVYLFREAVGSSAIPLTVGLLGGVDVAVPEEHYDEAAALLESDASDHWNQLPPELEAGDEEP